MRVQLPPLAALQAFEAAGRRMSFRLAAEELNVTASAVSHRIRTLEDHLRVKLFHRLNRGLAFTEPGQRYFSSLQEIFVSINNATNNIASHSTRQKLTIHSVPSIGSLWLMPRLHQFVARFPNIDLRVSGSPEFANFVSDHVDIDIRYGKPNWKGLQVVPLMKEEVMPLCSPRLLEGPNAIRTPADLDHATLIELDSAIMGWNDWFELNGLDPPQGGQHLHFDRSVMSIQAGVDGLGVILDSTTLAAQELAAGRLVRPFADSTRSLEVTGHFLVYPRANAKIPIVAAFLAWVSELQT